MTDEDASPPPDERPPGDDDGGRAARLAELLSVDISPRSGPTVDDVDAADVEVATDDAATAEAIGDVAARGGQTGPRAADAPAAGDHTGTADGTETAEGAEAVESAESADGTEGAAGPAGAGATDGTDGADEGEGAGIDRADEVAVVVAAPARAPWRRVLAGGVLVALLVAGVGLAYAGTRIVRSSTQGEVRTPVDDPDAPGFEALVDPTPTMAVLHDTGGLIDGITVLTLPDPDGSGGGVLLVPTRTVTDVPLYEESPLEIAYDLGDQALQTQAVGRLLGAAMQESTVVDAERWADLVGPVAPLELENPNELRVDGEVRFPAGEIELAAEDVGPYLEATVEGESDLARLFRHELFWRAWLDAVAADGGADAVPGELQSGIGSFVRGLAGGRTEIETLPVEPAPTERFGDDPAFVPRPEQMADLVGRLIPFPRSPEPGQRARVRVLNGTTDTSEAASIAPELPPAGVEVVLVGNAASLDVERTTIAHFGEEFRDEAEEIADILGVGRVVADDAPSDAVDITVTLGADL